MCTSTLPSNSTRPCDLHVSISDPVVGSSLNCDTQVNADSRGRLCGTYSSLDHGEAIMGSEDYQKLTNAVC